jgi:hypothetical protein
VPERSSNCIYTGAHLLVVLLDVQRGEDDGHRREGMMQKKVEDRLSGPSPGSRNVGSFI